MVRETLLLINISRFQTVTKDNQWFMRLSKTHKVSPTDILINIGKQAKVMPRCLFKQQLVAV